MQALGPGGGDNFLTCSLVLCPHLPAVFSKAGEDKSKLQESQARQYYPMSPQAWEPHFLPESHLSLST